MPMAQTLTQKAGPLPIWAWAGLGTVALTGYMIYRKKQQMNAAAAAQAQTGSSNLGTVPISNLSTAAQPMPTSNGPVFVDINTNTDSDNPTPIHTPPRPWPAQGPTGGPPTPTPVKPKPVPVKPLPPAAKPPPAPPPTNNQTVTVCSYPSWCGSLYGIAQHLWGNGNLWPAIYAANKTAIGPNPNLIHVNTVLKIPAKPAA